VETPVVAVYDANVLYAIPVCDCLMWVALEGLVRARWSVEIHEEWIRNLLMRRIGNTTRAFDVQGAHDYISMRWQP
jgi:hypothetical protein